MGRCFADGCLEVDQRGTYSTYLEVPRYCNPVPNHVRTEVAR